LLGLGPAVRESRFKRGLFWIIVAGLAGLLPFSMMRVKEPLYVLSCVVFLYFLTAVCLAALTRSLASGKDLSRTESIFGMGMIVCLLIFFPLAYATKIQPGKITAGFVLAHTITLGLILALFLFFRRKRGGLLVPWTVYTACAGVTVFLGAYTCATHKPLDREIASLTEPWVSKNPPGMLSMIAPNFKSYQFYSFHKGRYWHEMPLKENPQVVLSQPAFKNVRVFILDALDQEEPEMGPWLRWLESSALEKTSELNNKLGITSGYRVFVRDATEPALTGSASTVGGS
jgi:hypothetical protein